MLRRPATEQLRGGGLRVPRRGRRRRRRRPATPHTRSPEFARCSRRSASSSAAPRAGETPADLGARIGAARSKLLAGGDLSEALAEHELVIAPEALVYIGHFITPPREGRRYDTRFFAFAAPADQEVRVHAAEAVEGGWHRPESMLGLDFPAIMPPTRMMCHEFARLGSVDAILKTLGAHPIEETEITPEIIAGWMALQHEQGARHERAADARARTQPFGVHRPRDQHLPASVAVARLHRPRTRRRPPPGRDPRRRRRTWRPHHQRSCSPTRIRTTARSRVRLADRPVRPCTASTPPPAMSTRRRWPTATWCASTTSI